MAFQFINDEQSQDRCEESLSGDVRQQVLTLMCCDVRDIAEICAPAHAWREPRHAVPGGPARQRAFTSCVWEGGVVA